MSNILLIVDGGSRGNPGPIYGAYYFEVPNGDFVVTGGPAITEFGEDGTNNDAEYRAMVLGLDAVAAHLDSSAKPLHEFNLVLLSDSQLVVNQVLGIYQVRAEKFLELKERVLDRLFSFRTFTVQWVPRDITNAYLGC